MNPVEIEEAVTQLASDPFDRGEFPFQFLTAFGNKKTTIDRLRKGNTNQSDIPGGVLQRNNIHIAACERGSVSPTLAALRENPKTASAKARYILATDGIDFQAEDLVSGETVVCDYADFPDHFGFFLPLAGITTVEQIRESSFDIRATSRLNKLYVTLLQDNPDWAREERRPDMNHFMARLIFCFFAEDTDIFHPGHRFTATVEKMSAGGAENTHDVIRELFRAMNTPIAKRKEEGIARWADPFPYVNGHLFSGSIDVPRFSKIARSYLIHIGNLDWTKINPDIFGSMIQAVADDEERGALGMHYTSVPNILKVLNPLFLDDLRAKLEEAGDNSRKLLNLRNRMARIRVFDPACGSGNFLVIAYKEMRAIEAEINRRRGEADRKTEIPLTNFRGIEYRDFPAEIARLALIIAEYQCDVLYRGQREALADFLPLDSENWIICGNALRLDWLSICPPTGTSARVRADDLFQTPLDQSEIDFENAGGETYLCGNPPYQGSVNQTAEQKEDMSKVFSRYLRAYKDLDYVASWVVKAAEFAKECESSAAFVCTNSICQGEQVGMLWPIVRRLGSKVAFAHTSFAWSNNAANNAGVSCIVVGLANKVDVARLYEYDIARTVETISPYLTPNSDVIVQKRSNPLSNLGEMVSGNKATDGGNLILDRRDANDLMAKFPHSKDWIKRLEGAREFIQGSVRWCLWLSDKDHEAAQEITPIARRIEAVKKLRSASRGKQANDAARFPHRFVYTPHTRGKAILIPSVSSERREYIPCGPTGRLQVLQFAPSEDRDAYFRATRSYVITHGRPVRIQTDKHSAVWSVEGPTEFDEALEKLNIIHSVVHSPQSKGRVERCHRTLQDRLVKAFRRAAICTIEEANLFAPEFIKKYNTLFAKPAVRNGDNHRPLGSHDDVEAVFSRRQSRRLTTRLTFSYRGSTYVIGDGQGDRNQIGRNVLVESRLDGTMVVSGECGQLKVEKVH